MAVITGCIGARFLTESGDARDLLTKNEGVHVVRAFVGIHRFEVCQMAHRLILREDAVRSQQASGFAGNIGGHIDVVTLSERNLLWTRLPVVLEPAKLQA